MRILVSNDDGILSKGIHVLAETLKEIGEVVVVAPSQERSTTAHSLTLHKPLRIQEIKKDYYHVNGTPADCVHFALKKVCVDRKPDLVFSGINRGANLGYDVHYSGTVAAAREASIMKLPSIAVSLNTRTRDVEKMHFDTAAYFAMKIAKTSIHKKLPLGVYLNVNVPDLPKEEVRGIRVVKTGVRLYSNEVIEKKDPRGQSYYWLGGGYIGFENIKDTDCKVVEEGFVSITPLQVDSTEHAFLSELKNWDLKING